MASFDAVADEYDAGRPSYPPGVYDTLGPLEGLLVLDVGAGTGIATRQLLERGASVIAVDHGRAMLARAAMRTPGLSAVVADGAVLPVRGGTADLICFAQAWHWLDQPTGTIEAHRVLASGGRWAAWWTHARADAEDWFDTYWALIEGACPGTHRRQRDADWGSTVAASHLFQLKDPVVVAWPRQVSVDGWMTDQASHSYVAALPEPDRTRLLGDLRRVLDQRYANEAMTVPHETWIWIGTKT